MKKVVLILISALMMFGMAGCDKESNNKSKNKLTAIRNSNLGGAKAAFITGNVSNLRASAGADYESLKFYKVGVNGETQTVEFTNDEGNTVEAVVDFVQSLSSRYAVMRVRNKEQDWQVCVFIIRKSDGKLFTTLETLEKGWTSFNDDPLGIFTWDGGDGEGIDYSRLVKSNANGDIFYNESTNGYNGMLYKIHENNGNTTIANVGQVGEYYKINQGGHVYDANIYAVGDETQNLYADWITPSGQKIPTNWFINEGPIDEIVIGVPFSLSCNPNSFFTIDDVYDGRPGSGDVVHWLKSVLAEYRVQDGEVIREVVHEFSKKIGQNSVSTSIDGLAVAIAIDQNGWLPTGYCYIKAKNNVIYDNKIETDSDLQNFDLQNLAFSSKRYVYCFNSNELNPSFNKILRLDPQIGTVEIYYTVPSEYEIMWVWVTYTDVLTIWTRKGDSYGPDVYIEVDAQRNATIHDTYNGEKVIMRSAF